jgi:hypothetical protein
MAKMNENEILKSVLPHLQFIHDFHNETIEQGKALKNADGSITTTYSIGVPYKDKIYEVPGYDRDAGKKMTEDEAYEKYVPMLESGELQETYGDFGIPKGNYKTILNLYQQYKKMSDYGNVPESAIKYYESK